MTAKKNGAINVRVPIELYKRLNKMKNSWETWGSFLNRMIPEQKKEVNGK